MLSEFVLTEIPNDPGNSYLSFNDSGVKTMNWSGVNWVDITTQYTKAKTSDFVLTEIPNDPGNYYLSFDDWGVKTMNWSGVNWVDITTQYTKAKTSDFVLTEGQTVPEPSSALLILSGMCAFLMRRRSV